MCGRFTLFQPPERVEERFAASFDYPYERRYNAAPGQALPVITDDRPERIRALEWGLVPTWADDRDDVGTLINARAETVAEKPSFREAFAGVGEDATPEAEAAGRCLVLADGFYEWTDTDDGRRPYRITRRDDEPFAMAGLWTRWRPPDTQTGLAEFGAGGPTDEQALRETFTIVTTEANGVVGELHDRMPVVLPPADERLWLTAGVDEARSLLQPAPEAWLRAYPVSRAVNDPSNDRPAVVEEVDLPG